MANTGRVIQISSQISNDLYNSALALLDDGKIKNLLEYLDIDTNYILPINFSVKERVIRQIAIGGKYGVGLAILDNGKIIKWNFSFSRRAIVSANYFEIDSGTVIQIAQGYNYSLALLDNGIVRGWYGDKFIKEDINFLAEGKKIVQIAAGSTHALALLDDGTVRGWGNNDNGQRENKDFSKEGRNIKEIAAGIDHSLAILDDGTVIGWGNNTYGKCNSQNFLGTAVAPAEGRVIQIAAGYNHSLALLDDGTVRRWGFTGGIFNIKNNINFLESGYKIVQVVAGSIVLLDDGTIRYCGEYYDKCKKENFKKIIVDGRINFENIDLYTNFFISINGMRIRLSKYNDINDKILNDNFNLLDKVYYIIDINNEIIKNAFQNKSVLNKKYLLDNGIMGCIDVDKRLDDYVIITPPL